MSRRKVILFCFVYTLLQLYFGVDGVGLEGRGTFLLISPFRLFGLGWLCMIAALVWRASNTTTEKSPIGFFILGLMTLHYAITGIFAGEEITKYLSSPSADEGLGRVLARRPSVLIFGILFYLLGQIVCWLILLRPSNRKVPK